MANEKNIPVEAFDEAVQGLAVRDAVVDWHGLEITVKHTIGFSDMMKFVNDAAESCFSEAGTFVPEVMDFAIKSNILSRYANVALPEDLEHQYALIYSSDIVDAVCEHVNAEQLREITSAVRQKVRYACDANVTMIRQKTNELLSAFEELGKQADNMFAGVSQNDLQKLVGAISNGGFDEEALVKAYLKQTNGGNTKEAADQ